METIALKVESRDMSVKASTIRKKGKIPCVIYGGEHLEHVSTQINDVKHLIYTPEFKLADVDMGGKKLKCIVKDVQYHPTTDDILHIDFLALEDGRKVKVNVPVKFKGVSPGVKAGGKLMQTLRKVGVKVDPTNIIDELFIDISNLQLGASVRVKDIERSDNIEIMVNAATPVATVIVPRAVKSAAAEEEKAAKAKGAKAEK
jgi:large subunit ribosomal protein L25